MPLGNGSHDMPSCFHCGNPLPPGAHYPVDLPDARCNTCCHGCQAVARMIVSSGNAAYYRHRTSLPSTAAAPAADEILQQLRLYDLPEIQQSFVRPGEGDLREAALILEGIVCAACIWLNERHIAQLPGVVAVEINFATHRARVRWDNSRIQLSDILHAVRDIGYAAYPFDADRQEDVFRRERAAAQRRLAIAGLGMMQVMMYAIPAYLADPGSMTWDIQALMRWASLMLTLPVVFYSAWPFFLGAWRDLKRRSLGMDVPVALGVGAAFAASVWVILTHSGEVYFDSITMFVFFLLSGRYLEMGARRKSAAALETLAKLIPAVANRYLDYPAQQETQSVPVTRLAAGDTLLVKPGEAIPADGIVLAGSSAADESLLTGEARALTKVAGDRLVGGAINVTGPLVMRVEKTGADTVLSGILRLLDRAQAEKPRIARLADRFAAWFVLALLLLATGVALGWYWVEPARAFWITVSVLVVSCPCALGLATPAALTAAAGRLTGMGLLATRGHALETLARVTHVVFDKTGTLTYGRLTLLDTLPLGETSAARCRALASTLESVSEHPIAHALHDPAAPTLPGHSITNVPGYGLEGIVEGRHLRLGRPDFVAQLHGRPLPPHLELRDSQTMVALGDEQGWLSIFLLGDQLRPDAVRAVARLKKMGMEVSLLSGDGNATVAHVANQLGIEHYAGQLMPEDKLARMRALQSRGQIVAMVGDGVNDAPVLAAAQVSIAMGQGSDVAQASADMVMMNGQLERLADAMALARRTTAIIRQNLAWAVIYNLAAIPAAALGFVTPWMAGIGMSLSSLLVVLNALRLSRMRLGAGDNGAPVHTVTETGTAVAVPALEGP
ncbi:heavy metal translocating P-type ATPase [Sulfuriferula sp. GW1]|uniref:heavy metal translocating P-type ATPase n=1 Tax=Sulfuriferula sp. GW1 TaxID=3345111 RepID=UPI0039B097ED